MRVSAFLSTLAGVALAAPMADPRPESKHALASRDLNAEQIIGEVAPQSRSCADTAECRTAAQIAPLAVAAFRDYQIFTPAQMAAVLSLMAFETGDFKYKRNVFPGRPGQGTSNMQMYPYNLEYAQSIPALAGSLARLGVASGPEPSVAVKNQVLDLVVADEYNFGSAAWFLRNKCGAEVLTRLAASPEQGFLDYLKCVGIADVGADRVAYWTRAKAAFGLAA